MAKKSFILYVDSLCVLNELSDEQAGKLFKAIYAYHLGEKIELEFALKLLFTQLKNQFDRDMEKYETVCAKRKEAGAKGGKQKVANATKRKQKLANVADTDTDTDTDTVTDKDINIEFEEFWELYNKKVGNKGSCQKKWNKLSDNDRDQIIKTLPTFLKSISDKQYQPYPETYLNQKRWNDEIQKPVKDNDFPIMYR